MVVNGTTLGREEGTLLLLLLSIELSLGRSLVVLLVVDELILGVLIDVLVLVVEIESVVMGLVLLDVR